MFGTRPEKTADETVSIALSPDGRASWQEDGVVFLQLRTGVIFRSNRVGAVIWKGITDRQTMTAITAQVSRDYAVPLEQAARDAANFVAQLEANGLVMCR